MRLQPKKACIRPALRRAKITTVNLQRASPIISPNNRERPVIGSSQAKKTRTTDRGCCVPRANSSVVIRCQGEHWLLDDSQQATGCTRVRWCCTNQTVIVCDRRQLILPPMPVFVKHQGSLERCRLQGPVLDETSVNDDPKRLLFWCLANRPRPTTVTTSSPTKPTNNCTRTVDAKHVHNL